MTRPLRIVYEGAFYHITARGNERKSIFRRVRTWSITEQRVVNDWRAYWHDNASTFNQNASPNMIEAMTFSPGGLHLATMGFLKGRFAIRIWDYATKKLIHEFDDVISSSLPMCSGYPMAFIQMASILPLSSKETFVYMTLKPGKRNGVFLRPPGRKISQM